MTPDLKVQKDVFKDLKDDEASGPNCYFDPEAFKDANPNLTLEDWKMDTEELRKNGVEVTKLRRSIE